ncbi:MAG: 50S ribosomal protein L24 [Phycisphaerae bacterium]|nr:50S ribosomal protein L24 [Phycisphaerae bacterium]
MHVKKGDIVVVLAGDDKGKTGEVISVYPRDSKVLVQGVNRVFKHLKPSRQHPRGGRIQKEMPIHISNVLPLDPKTSKPTRVAFRTNEDGVKERVAKRSGQVLGSVKKK